MDRELKILLLATLGAKIAICTIIVANWYWGGFCEECRVVNFAVNSEKIPRLLDAFATWDGQHYIQIAQHWYQPEHISNAFYPLLPALMRVVHVVIPNWIISGLLITNAAMFGAMATFYAIVKQLWDKETALTAGIAFLAFPTAYYSSLIYNESLFLLLTLLAFWGIYTKRLWLTLLCGILLPLVRPQGVLVLAPLIVVLWSQKNSLSFWLQNTLTTLCFAIGSGVYLFTMHWAIGDAFAGLGAQHVFRSQVALDYVLHPTQWFAQLWPEGMTFAHFPGKSLLDRLFAVLFVAILYGIYHMRKSGWFLYALLIGGVPLLTSNLMSFPRYLYLVFPLFVWFAVRYKGRRAVPFTLLALTQILLLLRHSSNFWVA